MSNRGDLLRVRARFKETQAKQETRLNRFLALMGNGEGDLAVPGSPLFVYVRVQGRGVVECLNQVAPLRNDLPIIVGYDFKKPDTLQVLSIYEGGMSSFGPYAYLPAHHQAHEFRNSEGGDDVVWIQKQQVLPLLAHPTSPTSMTVVILDDWYPWDTGWHYFEETVSADLTVHIPALAAQARYVLISIDGATEALQYTIGALFPILLPPPDAENMIPAPPSGSIPIVGVYLTGTTTAIDWENLYDLRLFNQPVGGSVSPGPHSLLDSTVHGDTVTNAPTRGSLVVANATPDWDKLVHPGGAGYALTTDANDVIWDQTPAWTGNHAFNAGLTIPAGQGITMGDLAWIGLGPAAGRLIFDDAVPDVASFDGCGHVNIENVLGHIGDPDTYLLFSPDFAGFRVGGVDFLYMDENGVDEFEVNPGGVDIDLIVQAVGVADALLVQGSDGQITLGALTAGFVKSSAAGVLSVALEVTLAELAGYARGSIIRGGAADWEAYALAGAAGYALVSTATDIVWDQTPLWTGRHSFAAGITFTGGAGVNSVVIPDALADAFDITDGVEFLRLDTANDYFLIDPAGAGVNTGIGGVTGPNATVAIGAAGNAALAHALYEYAYYNDRANATTSTGFKSEVGYRITTTRANYVMSTQIVAHKYSVADGVTNTGYNIAIAVEAFVNDVNFAGTLGTLIGMKARVGIHAVAGAGARTVTNAYGVYIENLHNAGTITNNFGLYQASSGAKNYFAGRTGIGTTTPFLNFGTAAGDFGATWSGLHVYAQEGGVLIEGDDLANIYMADRGAGVNDKIGSLRVNGGEFIIGSLNDALSAWVHEHIVVIDLSTGNVGFGCVPNSLMEWDFATENLEFVDAGSVGAGAGGNVTDWVEVEVGGVQGYLKVYDAKG